LAAPVVSLERLGHQRDLEQARRQHSEKYAEATTQYAETTAKILEEQNKRKST
jgi:hypothetical protein